MGLYRGIRQEAFWLLAENRFHDSKSYYEENKERLKQEVLEPLRAQTADLATVMEDIDPQIVVNPTANGCVSRIRRDNRYTRDKSMYRENVWVAFLRDKRAWECLPGFYIDMSMQGSSRGLGFYWASPRLMQTLREMLDEKPGPILAAAQQALDAGFQLEGDVYARPKRGEGPPLLLELYNRKIWEFNRHETGPALAADPALPSLLEQEYRALAPLYRVMIAGVERELETRGREEGA